MGWGSRRRWFSFGLRRSALASRGLMPRFRRRILPRRTPGFGLTGLLLVTAIIFAAYGFVLGVDRQFRPNLQAIAVAKARMVAAQAINEATGAGIFSGIDYEKLIRIQMDAKGERILMIQPDTVTVNRIADQAVRAIQQKMKELNGRSLPIPISEIMGLSVLGNFGPTLNVTIVPLGMAQVNVRSRFEPAGINQTHHVIIMETRVVLQAVVPLVSEEVAVTVETPLTDAVITGDVPSNYWNVKLGGS